MGSGIGSMTTSRLTKPANLTANSDQRLGYLGLLLAGVLMGLWPAWPLAWVALLPLWWVIHRGVGLRKSALCALIWGVGYHGTMLGWVLHLHPLTWLGIPWLWSVAIALFAYVFVTLWGAGIAVVWAVGMAALQRVASLGNIGRVLVGTALWCGIEALWSTGPLYWTSLAITQSPGNLVIVHLARLSGHLTITAVIVAVNGALAVAAARMWKRGNDKESVGYSDPQTSNLGGFESLPSQDLGVRRNANRYGLFQQFSKNGSRQWLMAAVGMFAIAHLVGLGLYQQSLQDQPEDALKIGIIQGNIPSREKLTYQGVRRAEDLYRNNYRQLAEDGADAVLTPEGAIPTRWDQETSIFSQMVRDAGIPLWLGTFTMVPADNEHIYQSLVEITPNGTTQYNKIKLVPLGEYIPLQSVFGNLIARLSPISTDMQPGQPTQRFETALGQAAVGICYDSAYGWIFQQQVTQGGEFILTASNNDPYPSRMMAQHHGQDVIQAISTDRWAARSTNTGLSAVVDPHGRMRWSSVPLTVDAHIETIYRRSTQTLYVRWGNWLVPVLLLMSGVWVVRSRFRY